MKKILSLIIFFSLTISYLVIPLKTLAHPLLMLNEGFLKSTLIKTLKGYTAIQNLDKKSVIAALGKDGKICEQEVWDNQKLWVESYVNIYSDENKLVMGINQKLYLPQEGLWINAQDAVPGQQLAPNFTIDSVEIINEPIEIYALTTSSHYFHVTKYDVIAHNMNAGASAASVVIGRIIAYCPVTSVLEAVASLLMGINDNPADASLITEIAQSKTPEASYYDKKRPDLERLRDRFINVINDLKSLGGIRNPLYFTYDYLSSIKHDTPSIPVDESRFNRRQIKALQQARDAHLNSLEQEIFELNITLCSHLNELIEHRNTAELQFDQAYEELKKSYWSTPEDARIYCEHLGKLENAVEDFEKYNDELIRIAQYYLNSDNASIVRDCSNVSKILDIEYAKVQEQKDFIRHAKKWIQDNNSHFRQFYVGYKIDIQGFQKQLKINNKKASKVELNRSIRAAKNRRDKIKAPEVDKKVQKVANDGPVAAAGGGGMPPEDPWGNGNKQQSGEGQEKPPTEEEKLKAEQFRKSVEHAMIENNREHYFEQAKHGFEELLNEMGGPELQAQQKLIEQVISQLLDLECISNKVLFKVPIKIAGRTICVKGRVMDNVIKIATMFILK